MKNKMVSEHGIITRKLLDLTRIAVYMTLYLAHYRSPAAADVRGAGAFEFESDARAGSKENVRDARMKMLEMFGKDAASWNIEKVERKTTRNGALDGQLELDFRPAKKRRRRRTKEYW